MFQGPTIRCILFDLGRVLLHFDFGPNLEKLAEKSPLSAQDVFQLVAKHPILDAYETGKVDTPTFLQQLQQLTQFSGTLAELNTLWCEIFEPMDQHIVLAQALAREYPLGLLSNTCPAHIQLVESRYSFFSIFQQKIYSYEVGFLKPAPEIYEIALQRMGSDRYETLFIDDLEENVAAAAKIGMQTIHLRPDVSLLHALQSYDLEGVRALDI